MDNTSSSPDPVMPVVQSAPSGHKNILITILLLLVMSLIVVGLFVFIGEDKTSNWETYEGENGLVFKYPPNWKVEPILYQTPAGLAEGKPMEVIGFTLVSLDDPRETIQVGGRQEICDDSKEKCVETDEEETVFTNSTNEVTQEYISDIASSVKGDIDTSSEPDIVESDIMIFDLHDFANVRLPIRLAGEVKGGDWTPFEGSAGVARLYDDNGKELYSADLRVTSDPLELPATFETFLGEGI